jgi:antitoxin component YwqK of YwqJK toxin-antitoxin module
MNRAIGKYYFENGNLSMEGKFENNKEEEVWKHYYEKGKIFIEIIQSLQQTEWDVEIAMEYQGFEEDGKLRETYLPKLDENGCLILKRL